MKKTAFTLFTAFAVLTGAASFAEDEHTQKRDHGKGMLEKVDLVKNGKISQSEFIEKSKKRFIKMDGNKDGYLTRDEMKNARKKMHKHMKNSRDKKTNESEE
ncbi:MAG: Ca2+-binding EF-hand superfamily protein [Alphaproteobacteria bacterium]|jgi:Ca2+-binding EF-hand superfamily protein